MYVCMYVLVCMYVARPELSASATAKISRNLDAATASPTHPIFIAKRD